jgi:RND family efflux transporter MFP subunit
MRVSVVHVPEGSYVTENDLLFELDDEYLQQVVRQRDAEFTAAKAELELVHQSTALNQKIRELELASAEANVQFRNEDLNSRNNLLQSLLKLNERSASTSLEVLQAKTSVSQATFDLTEAKHRLQRAQDAATTGQMRDKLELEVATAKYEGSSFALEIAQKDRLACRIKSPMAGYVTQVNAIAGEVIEASAELAKLAKLDPIFVRVDFPQERIDDVSLAQTAEVVLDSYPKETFQGTVVRISPQANSQLRIVPIIVKLENPGSRIKAGISGFARIHLRKAALVVPAAAVIERSSRAMTFRVQNGHARICEVRTGSIIDNGWVEVRGGLDEGDEVVIYDAESLRDNDAVDVNWRKWARRD